MLTLIQVKQKPRKISHNMEQKLNLLTAVVLRCVIPLTVALQFNRVIIWVVAVRRQ